MYDRSNKKIEIYKRLMILVPILILVFLIGVVILKKVDEAPINESIKRNSSSANKTETVEINGVLCTPKKNIQTFLFIGNDNSEEREETGTVLGGGQCDTLELIVVDKGNEAYYRLSLNRDTMTEIESFDSEGNSLGTSVAQLSLAYAQGGGEEKSCENAAQAVSNLLYGQKIDEYLSLNMDAIPTINNMVGGVEVIIEDDFSRTDSGLVMGETVTLTDEQAIAFVQGRKNVADGTNENRVKRQNTYLSALQTKMISLCKNDPSFSLEFFNSLEDYMVTSFTGKKFSRLTNTMVTYEDKGRIEPEGSSALGRFNYNEFTIDEDNLADIVMELFYEQVDEEK